MDRIPTCLPVNFRLSGRRGLWDGFALGEGCGDGGAWLGYVETLFGVVGWVDETFVFVTPDDHIKERLDKVFR